MFGSSWSASGMPSRPLMTPQHSRGASRRAWAMIAARIAAGSGKVSAGAVIRSTGAAGHRRDDSDLVAGVEAGRLAGAVADVFSVDEDVDEAPDAAVRLAEPLPQPRVAGVQPGQQLADRA